MAGTKRPIRAHVLASPKFRLEKGMRLEKKESYASNPLKLNGILVKVKSVGVNPADPTFAELGRLAKTLIKPHPIAGMDFQRGSRLDRKQRYFSEARRPGLLRSRYAKWLCRLCSRIHGS